MGSIFAASHHFFFVIAAGYIGSHTCKALAAAGYAPVVLDDLSRSIGIDKSVLAVAAPRRYRNREHLRYVAKQPCLICGRRPSDPHHLRYLQPRALGRRASDEFVVPLCRSHHRAVHRAREERAWWWAAGIDPDQVARKLWKHTRIDEGQIAPDATAQAAADQTSRPDGHGVGKQAPA
jgi:hypothetical protein